MRQANRPMVPMALTWSRPRGLLLRALVVITALGLMLLAVPSRAYAGPILQLYLEGATYDTVTESWVITPPGSSAGEPFRLWAIGNVGGPGGKGVIHNVRLSTVYDAAAGNPLITITPSTTGGYGGYTDPSTPSNPVYLQTVSDGSTPIMGDGKSLPAHGEYGPGRVWQEFLLGDFTLMDSPFGDFIGSFPTPSAPNSTQINVYEVSVFKDLPGPLSVHFDLYDTIDAKNHAQAKFAPFSHDADGTATIAPEPSALAIWSLLAVFTLAMRRRPKRG